MLLSALALAAALQAAPTVVIPEAPVVGHKGYLLQQRPFDRSQRVDQLRMPFAKHPRPVTAEEARTGRSASPFTTQPQRSPLKFVGNPKAGCNSQGLSRAGHPETLTVQPLSKLPKAHGERAVARLVDGCPVSVLIAQNDPLH